MACAICAEGYALKSSLTCERCTGSSLFSRIVMTIVLICGIALAYPPPPRHAHAHTHMRTHMLARTHARTHARTRTHLRTRAHARVHTHKHTKTHTHAHTRAHMWQVLLVRPRATGRRTSLKGCELVLVILADAAHVGAYPAPYWRACVPVL